MHKADYGCVPAYLNKIKKDIAEESSDASCAVGFGRALKECVSAERKKKELALTNPKFSEKVECVQD